MEPTKKGLLAVSFGTSYEETRKATIEKMEEELAAAFPDYRVYRAWTSKMIIRRIRERDHLIVDTVTEALQRMAADGITSVLIQPTHIANGLENDRMKADARALAGQFEEMRCGAPLLTAQEDLFRAAGIIGRAFPEASGDTALVLMGHGTEHYANTVYAALDYVLKDQGYPDIYVGTVEAYPEFETILRRLQEKNYRKVILTPFMIVAGDHANNDMAGGEEDSWKSQLEKAGYEVECVLKGLGEYPQIREMLIEHCRAAESSEEVHYYSLGKH